MLKVPGFNLCPIKRCESLPFVFACVLLAVLLPFGGFSTRSKKLGVFFQSRLEIELV